MTEEMAEVAASQPSAMDKFWLDSARTAAKESIPAMEEAAKQLIGIASLAQGIYFAAISFSDLKYLLPVQDPQRLLMVLLFAGPVILWLFSLAFAVRVFIPQTYSTSLQSPDLARQMLLEIAANKHRQLRLAHQALLLGFLLLAVDMILYLAFLPAAAEALSSLNVSEMMTVRLDGPLGNFTLS